MARKIDPIQIRAMTTSDITAAMQLVMAAGWNQTPADWQMILHNPGTHLVAVGDQKLVGTICALDYRTFIWVAMVLVNSEYRRQGIATTLMEKILDIYSDRTIRLDATEAGGKVYQKIGFHETRRLIRWQISRPRSASNVPKKINFKIKEHEDQLKKYDQSVFGGDRSIILNCLMENYPSQCLFYSSKTNPGYILGRAGSLAWQIGPLVANNLVEADNLLNQVLKQYPDYDFYLDSFTPRESWNRTLQDYGFTQQRTLIRMQLGSSIVFGNESKQFAITGPDLG